MLARMLVALPLLAMILAYVVSPGVLAWASVSLPTGVRIGAVLMGVMALLGSAWALSSIGSNISPTVLTREGQRLVEQGPYRWIRHPLYTSGTLLLISIGVVAQNLLILCWIALGLIPLLAVVIPREERELVRRFGAEYEEYRDRTGAMLPKLL